MLTHERLLSELVEIESYSGNESGLRDFISHWFVSRGIEAQRQGENLYVHIPGADDSRAFIFNAHMDTVKPNEEWVSKPLTPTFEGDKMVGLGVSDMKSGLAATMLLADQVHKTGAPPVDLWFVYVVKEEADGSGSADFANWFSQKGYTQKYKDIAAIFAEPNSLAEVEYGHRGNYFLIAEAKGPSGHAARPNEIKKGERLAVRKMIDFANMFQEAVIEWNDQNPDPYFKPAITVGEMTSFIANAIAEEYTDEKGKKKCRVVPGSINKFPESCVATFDLRTTPTTHDDIYKKVLELAQKGDVEIRQYYPPAGTGFTDPNEKIVKVASRVGNNRTLTVSQASADLGFFTANGVKSVILGPGEKLQCHEPNEYAYPAQIPQAVELYKQIVEAWSE